MDIFERIENQDSSAPIPASVSKSTSKIVKKEDGRFYVADVKYRPELCVSEKFAYRCRLGEESTKEGFWARRNANNLYKYLMDMWASYGKFYHNAPTEKQKQKMIEKVKSYIKKGVNFSEYFTLTMGVDIIKKVPEDIIEILYNHGFDVKKAISSTSDAPRRNIYYTIKDSQLEDYSFMLIRNIPIDILEKIINTRQGLKISDAVVTSLFEDMTRRYSCENHSDKLEMLFSYGVISLSPYQLRQICFTGISWDKCPNISAAYDLMVKTAPSEEKKYSTQKTMTNTATKSSTDAQEVIDKLFEDAQKSVE